MWIWFSSDCTNTETYEEIPSSIFCRTLHFLPASVTLLVFSHYVLPQENRKEIIDCLISCHVVWSTITSFPLMYLDNLVKISYSVSDIQLRRKDQLWLTWIDKQPFQAILTLAPQNFVNLFYCLCAFLFAIKKFLLLSISTTSPNHPPGSLRSASVIEIVSTL